MKKTVLFVLTFLVSASLPLCAQAASGKPFKRALIIAGGGLSPGSSLGLLAGLKAGGYNPDVVLTTCGSSISASIYGGFDSPQEAYAYARSPEYFRVMKSLVRLEETSALNLLQRLKWADANPGVLPQLFSGTLLNIPPTVPRLLARESFPMKEGSPRFVILAAKAFFGPGHAGIRATDYTLYRQVFFTDPQTARYLKGRRSAIARRYPGSYVDPRTEVITGVSMVQAARASVSDPFFINPGLIDGSYYFTGAIDLFPIDTAKALADEVIVTFPNLKYSAYDVTAMKSAFGFDPEEAAVWASRQKGITWIGPDGRADYNFDPKPWGITMVNSLPSTAAEFAARVDLQYRVAFAEAYKAAVAHRAARE